MFFSATLRKTRLKQALHLKINMNIQQYLSKLKDESLVIFEESLKYQDSLGKAHHFSSCIHEFSENISDNSERDILKTVSSQLEFATLNVAMGMYRQAFSSLRLAFEMGLGAAHFSVHKLEFNEWLDGRYDINWSCLIDAENGVLSNRYANAFFEELSSECHRYRELAASTYRKLSEYVHGNIGTWKESGLYINFNQELLESYFQYYNSVSEIVIFVLCCRYLKSFTKATLESLEFVPEEMSNITQIREFFGGPKEL